REPAAPENEAVVGADQAVTVGTTRSGRAGVRTGSGEPWRCRVGESSGAVAGTGDVRPAGPGVATARGSGADAAGRVGSWGPPSVRETAAGRAVPQAPQKRSPGSSGSAHRGQSDSSSR